MAEVEKEAGRMERPSLQRPIPSQPCSPPWPAAVGRIWGRAGSGQRQSDYLPSAAQHFNRLVVIKAPQRLSVHLNNLVVDLDPARQVRNATGVDALDKDARQLLCRNRIQTFKC